MRKIKIAPSNLSYNLGGCHRCFAEGLNGEQWPDRPFPGIFARLDRQQRAYFDGKPTTVIDPGLPPGVVRNAAGVVSKPFVHNGVALTIRGTLDAVAELDDGTVRVIDFKSSIPNDRLGDRYRPQLSAYQWALEHPLNGDALIISGLGLLVVCPEEMADTDHGPAQLVSATWIEIEYDEHWFESLLEHVAEIAIDPASADSYPYCDWCELREQIVVGL
jgi:hypothetical protein